MNKLKKTFERCIGAPIPRELLPDIDLLPCFDLKAEDALLFGSAAAYKNPWLVQGRIDEFIKEAPEGYFLIGFWGHGANSYAFYYSRVDAWSRIFFRLPYGGVYMNNEDQAAQIREFLAAYLQFEKDIRQKGMTLIAVESMWEGRYELVHPSGTITRHRGSLLKDPEFNLLTNAEDAEAQSREAEMTREKVQTRRAAGSCAGSQKPSNFSEKEIQRQAKFKQERWPYLPDGAWPPKSSQTYAHILPEGDRDKAFYEPIAVSVLKYCDENKIHLHQGISNLNSSQAACFNILFPLKSNAGLARDAFASLLPGVTRVNEMEFEYTGDEGARIWLGEPKGKRGQNQTSIDVAIFWEDSEGSNLTLVEWKYTESSYGACRGFSEEAEECSNLRIQAPVAETQCYLTRGKNARRYWEHAELSGIDVQALAKVTGCPFRGPAYQLWRQYLLAAYCREMGKYNKVEVASVSFSGNKSLHQVPGYLESLGSDMLSAWNNLLDGVPKMRHVTVEEIIDRLQTSHLPIDAEWMKYLHLRYGL